MRSSYNNMKYLKKLVLKRSKMNRYELNFRRRRRRRRNMPNHIPRIIIDRANPLEVYNDIEFKRPYRFSKETFLILANDIINNNVNN